MIARVWTRRGLIWAGIGVCILLWMASPSGAVPLTLEEHTRTDAQALFGPSTTDRADFSAGYVLHGYAPGLPSTSAEGLWFYEYSITIQSAGVSISMVGLPFPGLFPLDINQNGTNEDVGYCTDCTAGSIPLGADLSGTTLTFSFGSDLVGVGGGTDVYTKPFAGVSDLGHGLAEMTLYGTTATGTSFTETVWVYAPMASVPEPATLWGLLLGGMFLGGLWIGRTMRCHQG